MTETAAAPGLLDGSYDLVRAAEDLAARLPQPMAPFARIAYNYLWSWTPGGRELFAAIDPVRWERANCNPVRLLLESSAATLERVASDAQLMGQADAVLATIEADRARPPMQGRASAAHPVAFLCAEFAVHTSLPIYAGGLGVLAGDILKEASDLAVPMVAVGLLYRQGYFIQRMDRTGYQHEYWMPLDPDRVPAALVRNSAAEPLTVSVPLRGRQLVVQVWRVQVGRVPLFLLDADRPENSRIDRWITARLYESDRGIRLAQYALLGIGSMRVLDAMGMDPAIVHLNEGHAALAPLELARRDIAAGADRYTAFAAARERTVFTTHTPVAAGNEGYDVAEIAEVMGDFPGEIGMDFDSFLQLGRTRPENLHEPFVMTPLGIKMSRAANGVSRRHGEVARQMWQPLFPERPVDTVPIGHVTNGVHLTTWMVAPMRALLDRHLEPGWVTRAADPQTWAPVDNIPDEELWALRCRLRGEFVEYVRDRSVATRLARSEEREMVAAAERGFSADSLTIGFARRLATYKRLYLITLEPHRVAQLISNLERPMQLILAGKAHPNDEEGKRSAQGVFTFKELAHAAERVAFLDNYDLGIASQLVAGCDLWVNLPRPPLEASGTSGMKSVLNGGLNLSVLDGWWTEAYDGANGWAISGDAVYDNHVQDSRDAAALYDLLEHEVAPLFYTRGSDGVPHDWVRRIKRSLRTNGPRFTATRMVHDYIDSAYLLASAAAE
ncbi:MAG: alpha-glucan family phosphorylase [Candidatus Dormibacteraeota bacterium]|uniref:glycogen phosphorylase n=1 Tax=Candidatus Aeolococcus gillhamiae TaxID=3127015 RepID=A0A2W5ZCA6_9BACT|nr:alpha-glucan family phosphorylase [Candidatus Dormibacteraeota bacterium]PZR83059.1 MAG: alpha-glucan phosphorylase [Candidatus Dormibacter sp. RRmetagenome_bin12]